MISATYHACRKAGGFFAQGFAFTRPPFRGCVPLDVTAGGQAQVRQYSPAEHVRRPAVPAESPTLGFTHLQFEALLTAAR